MQKQRKWNIHPNAYTIKEGKYTLSHDHTLATKKQLWHWYVKCAIVHGGWWRVVCFFTDLEASASSVLTSDGKILAHLNRLNSAQMSYHLKRRRMTPLSYSTNGWRLHFYVELRCFSTLTPSVRCQRNLVWQDASNAMPTHDQRIRNRQCTSRVLSRWCCDHWNV